MHLEKIIMYRRLLVNRPVIRRNVNLEKSVWQHFLSGHRTATTKAGGQGGGGGGQIDKLLVANRGEIACRVIRTARQLGVRTVAVYSDADVGSMHVAMADEAHHIGPAPSQDSYLRQDRIIQVAKKAGCQAIHPGYGFLSENAEFAEFCEKSGVLFVGPPASAIRDMGIKSTSKAIMADAGVPVIPGYHGDDQSNERLAVEAQQIGFPLMIKAVRGGGGKGMRVVQSAEEFLTQLDAARRESARAFGDEAVLLERFVTEPRHVEVQVFADQHGNCVHLFERDCSVQRRHQKVLEEAPGPGLSDSLRAQLGAAAVRAAKAVNYVGAGTVEFILDRVSHDFHFMEMNTRLQVEHPVTEMVTGVDLVAWQLQIAAGGRLPVSQDDIRLRGHAVEARVYAENPFEGFLPGAGPLTWLTTPTPRTDVRVETGVRQGDEVSVHYDPMIAKLVVWGNDRSTALRKMVAELRDYHVVGVDTNINFLISLCRHPSFRAADVHTNFIDEHLQELLTKRTVQEVEVAMAAMTQVLSEQTAAANKQHFSPVPGWRMNHQLVRRLTLRLDGQEIGAEVTYVSPPHFLVRVGSSAKQLQVCATLKCDGHRQQIICEVDGVKMSCPVLMTDKQVILFTETGSVCLSVPPPRYLSKLQNAAQGLESSHLAISPMPGVVEKVSVGVGDMVREGDSLVVVTAMKMEHSIRASRDAVVESIAVRPGDHVAKHATLVTFAQ